MTLFREELLIPQDEDLRVNTFTVDPEDDDDVETYNDDLGENTEVTPLGDSIDDEDIEDIKSYKVGPGDEDDDLLDDDDDLALDDDDVLLDDDDEIVDFSKAQVGPEDDDLLADDDDDDFLDDDEDDEILNPDVIPVVPDTDDDEDEGTWADDDENDDVLSTDDDDDFDKDENQAGSTTAGLNSNLEERHPERKTGRMIGHEPGIQGLGDGIL